MISGLNKFSNLNRSERLQKASKEFYDLIIIGGGITGAGIALDASLRGMKTLLVEKNDFASGTSSKSTKLIHGGLRYLKQFEIGLVRESGLERAIAHENACHLVHPESMFLPIVEGGSFSKFTASAAITVYDWLASVPSGDKKKMLNREKALASEPLLKESILKSGIKYSEYRTDDARLTIELIKAARRNDAEAFNYLEVLSFTESKGLVGGIKAKDRFTNDTVEINGDVVVNATGPWVDALRKVNQKDTKTNLRLSKGVHLVFNKESLPISGAIYFDAFDGRMIFAIPRGESVYVGTSDTYYEGNKDKLSCTQEDADYLLAAVNNFFDISPLSLDDVQSTWTGLRPLIQQEGKPATELSRRDEIFVSNNGLISIAGGKLTGFRKMAERIMSVVYNRSSKNFSPSKTKQYKIHHQPFRSYSSFLLWHEEIYADYKIFGFSKESLFDLLCNFGKDSEHILRNANLNKEANAASNEISLLKSQLKYCFDYESIFHPMDFLDRRTGWLNFDVAKVKSDLNFVTEYLADAFSHDTELQTAHMNQAKEIISRSTLLHLKNHSNQASIEY